MTTPRKTTLEFGDWEGTETIGATLITEPPPVKVSDVIPSSAPATPLTSTVGVRGTPVAPLTGAINVGGANGIGAGKQDADGEGVGEEALLPEQPPSVSASVSEAAMRV